MTEDDDFEQWSDDARESFIDASAALQAALAAQISTVSAARDDGDLAAVLAANDALDVAASAYSEAQFVLTGTFPAFDVVDLDDEEDEDHVEDWTAKSVMVLSRVVYSVTSESEVIESGRRAYLRGSPDDPRELAEADVTEVARALHMIAEDGGWNAVDTSEGLRRLGRTVWIVSAPTPSALTLEDPNITPFELDDGAALLYRVDEVL